MLSIPLYKFIITIPFEAENLSSYFWKIFIEKFYSGCCKNVLSPQFQHIESLASNLAVITKSQELAPNNWVVGGGWGVGGGGGTGSPVDRMIVEQSHAEHCPYFVLSVQWEVRGERTPGLTCHDMSMGLSGPASQPASSNLCPTSLLATNASHDVIKQQSVRW